jgi:quinol monooxygenase YgiN
MAYVVAAMWRAKEGKADDLAQVIAAMTPLSRQEPACITYEPHRSMQDPRLFFLYEVYADEAGYQAHRNTAHFQRYVVGDAIPNLLESRDVSFFERMEL